MKENAPHVDVGSGSATDSMEPNNAGGGHLKPRLSTVTMVGLTFAILNTWIALAGGLGLVMPSGSSVAFLYGFILCVLCNLCIGASLGEMASIWPTAGGQYHFAYSLCNEKWKKLASFCVGWTSIVGWLTLVTTEAFFGAQFFSAAGVLGSNGSYVPEAWKTYLIVVAISTYAMFVNLFGNRFLGKYNDCALYWSITGVVVISITILATGDKNGADFVFTDFVNATGYSDGTAWMLGLLQSALSLIGYDAVMHMTEEMPRPKSDAPKAILLSIVVGGVTGVAFILVMLFSLTDQETVFGTSTGLAIVELLYQTSMNRAGAVFMTVMLGVCFINGTVGSMTSASRLLFAMARDKGMVFPNVFGRIRKGLDVPVEAILFAQVFNLLFGLLYLGPTVAFGAFTASCTIFLNVSCAMPIAILLLRGRGVITAHQSPATPFTLGKWGYLCNIVSVIFVSVTTVFFCFPVAIPVDGNTMNYVSAVIGIFLILLTTYWFVYGSRFEGPKFDIIMGVADEEREAVAAAHGETATKEAKQ